MRVKTKFTYSHVGEEFEFKFSFPDDFILVVDTREQAPFFTRKLPKGLVMVRDTLPVGDYSIRGFETGISIERKSVRDLVNCLGRDHERFKNEMIRLAGYQFGAVVVEEPEGHVIRWHSFSEMHPESIRQALASIETRYRIHFYYGRDRDDCERWTLDRLIRYHRIKRSG